MIGGVVQRLNPLSTWMWAIPVWDRESGVVFIPKSKIEAALEYGRQMARRLNVRVAFYPHLSVKKVIWNGQYRAIWRRKGYSGYFDKIGEIHINVSAVYTWTEDQLQELVRHEIAHAIVDQRYNGRGHGTRWIRIARLLRVNVSNYLPGGVLCEHESLACDCCGPDHNCHMFGNKTRREEL